MAAGIKVIHYPLQLLYFKHPVDAWGGEEASGIIHDNVVIVGDAKFADLLCELSRCWHHMGKAASLVLDGLDVKVSSFGRGRSTV
jgi:hypothetical protein